MATPAQIEYLRNLMAELGYDEQDLGISIERLNTLGASQMIYDLKKELYG